MQIKSFNLLIVFLISSGDPFFPGKHTFEIVYPEGHRGTDATVGVGVEEAPLYVKGRRPLVGNDKFSWGVCLRTRRAFHKGVIVKKYPQSQVSPLDE